MTRTAIQSVNERRAGGRGLRLLPALLAVVAFASLNVSGLYKPGTRFKVDVPDLGVMWHNNEPARSEVYLPIRYTGDQGFPYVVWFADDKGSDMVYLSLILLGGESYIQAALPYQPGRARFVGKDRKKEFIAGGPLTDWAFQKPLLDKINETVPNINGERRIAAGHGTGATQVLNSIETEPGFRDYFYGFIVSGGSGPTGGLKHIKGRPMLIVCGSNDPAIADCKALYDAAIAAGVRAKLEIIDGVGHKLTAKEGAPFVGWVGQTASEGVEEAIEQMTKNYEAKKYPETLKNIRLILAAAPASSAGYTTANKMRLKISDYSKDALKELMAGNPNKDALLKFIDDWQGTSAVGEAKYEADQIGQKIYEGMKSAGTSSPDKWRAFCNEWSGFRCGALAKDELNALGVKEFELMMGHTPTPERILKFLSDWRGLPVRAEAVKQSLPIAQAELDRIVKSTSPSRLPEKLLDFMSAWQGTPIIDVAGKLLEEYSKKELDAIVNARMQSRRDEKLLKLIESYPDTEAAKEAEKFLAGEPDAEKKK